MGFFLLPLLLFIKNEKLHLKALNAIRVKSANDTPVIVSNDKNEMWVGICLTLLFRRIFTRPELSVAMYDVKAYQNVELPESILFSILISLFLFWAVIMDCAKRATWITFRIYSTFFAIRLFAFEKNRLQFYSLEANIWNIKQMLILNYLFKKLYLQYIYLILKYLKCMYRNTAIYGIIRTSNIFRLL